MVCSNQSELVFCQMKKKNITWVTHGQRQFVSIFSYNDIGSASFGVVQWVLWSIQLGSVKARPMAHSLMVVVLGEDNVALIICYKSSYWKYLQPFNHEIF